VFYVGADAVQLIDASREKYDAGLRCTSGDRYVTSDPIGLAGGLNTYGYVGGNSLKYSDPKGLQTEAALGACALGPNPVCAGAVVWNGCKWVVIAVGTGIVWAMTQGKKDESCESCSDDEPERTADDKLPRDKDGNPIPESDLPHTQLGTQEGRNGPYPQAREFGHNGEPVKDIDFTDHGRGHSNPHEHPSIPNPTGGTPQRGPHQPLNGGN